MSQSTKLTLEDIHAVFADEIERLGGQVADFFQDGSWLILRAILPEIREVGPHDRIQAGVALKASAPEIVVSPYIFRVICTNGAILAHILGHQPVSQSDWLTTVGFETSLRTVIQRCCAADIFAGATEQMRIARQSEADLAMTLIPHLSKMPPERARRFLADILNKWSIEKDRSQFGLMNTITALARATADPHERWALEELGGRVGVPRLTALHAALTKDTVLAAV